MDSRRSHAPLTPSGGDKPLTRVDLTRTNGRSRALRRRPPREGPQCLPAPLGPSHCGPSRPTIIPETWHPDGRPLVPIAVTRSEHIMPYEDPDWGACFHALANIE